MDIIDTGTFSFLPDPANSNSTIHQNIKWGYGDTEDYIDENGNVSIYIRYNKDNSSTTDFIWSRIISNAIK